jgi:two-component system, LytTR family, response regulator
MPFTTLIVDDEPLAREGLRMLLAADPEVSAIYEAKNGREALAAICRTSPDLVFLDVQMPEMDGFSVIRAIGADRMPPVVFVTAHDKHAIQAFEINAIDYLIRSPRRKRIGRSSDCSKASSRRRAT